MSENIQKIDTVFRLSDSSVNCYGFRLLTAGYMLAEFARNPIGYYMHGTAEYPKEAGALIRWQDLAIAGDNVTGRPVINLSHPRGERTAKDVIAGFLSAASMGHFVAFEMSEEKRLMLPGQKGPTVTKWYNRECSLVDIPGNYNALKELFDKDNNPLDLNNLSDSSVIIHRATSISLYVPEQKADSSTIIQPSEAAKNIDTPLYSQEPPMPKPDVSKLLGKAYTDGYINEGTLASLKENYQDKPERLPAILKILAENKCQLELMGKSWEELDHSGKLPFLKEHFPVGFEMKRLQAFGKRNSYAGLTAEETSTLIKMEVDAFFAYGESLAALSFDDVCEAEQLGFLKDNFPEVMAAKYQHRFGKEHPIVKEKELNKALVAAHVQKEKQYHINRLKAKDWDELDRSNGSAELKALDPMAWREKFKSEFGKYPKN